MIFGNGTLVANQVFQVSDLLQILLLKIFNVLLRYLDIAFKFKNIDEELPLVSQLFLMNFNLVRRSWVAQIVKNVEVHCILI